MVINESFVSYVIKCTVSFPMYMLYRVCRGVCMYVCVCIQWWFFTVLWNQMKILCWSLLIYILLMILFVLTYGWLQYHTIHNQFYTYEYSMMILLCDEIDPYETNLVYWHRLFIGDYHSILSTVHTVWFEYCTVLNTDMTDGIIMIWVWCDRMI